MSFTDTTRIFTPSTELSSWYDDNRLEVARYKFTTYGWLYEHEFFLDKVPDNSIQHQTVSADPYYLWSIQLCDGKDLSDLELLIEQAKKELQPVHSFDRPPSSKVFGSHGQVVFRHPYEHCFYGKMDKKPEPNELSNRVVRLQFHLENDKAGAIRASLEGLELMPIDYIYTPVDLLSDPDEKVCFDDF
jgi:hypothetical protein